MVETSPTALMRIYTDERARSDGSALHAAVIDQARKARIAGATVLRGDVGFGLSGDVLRSGVMDLSGNLPVIIELVDTEAKLRAFVPALTAMKDIGLVTIERVEVLHDGRQGLIASPGA